MLSPTGEIVTTAERFPFQPEWIFNANLGYENEEHDIGVNLVYNFTGEYATILKRVDTDANVIQSSLHSLDLQVRKGFDYTGGERLELSAGIKNLFATDKELTYAGGGRTWTEDRTAGSKRSVLTSSKQNTASEAEFANVTISSQFSHGFHPPAVEGMRPFRKIRGTNRLPDPRFSSEESQANNTN